MNTKIKVTQTENAKKFLAENPEIFDEIDRKVRIAYGLIEDDGAQDAPQTDVTAATENVDDVVLDLDDALDIEE